MGLATGSLMGLATLTLGWLGYTATQQPATLAQAPSLDKRVTASLTNASMDEVLQWLRKTGVNFVIERTDASAKTKLNINIVDKPLKDVMDAIASAVGGKWQKHGDVYTLNSRSMMWAPDMPDGMGGMHFEMPPDFHEHMAEIAPKIREHLGELEFEMGPELRGELLELAPRIREMMPEGGMHLRMLTDEQRSELFNSLTPKQKDLIKSRGHLVPEDLTSKQKELLKSLGDLQGSLRLKDGDREFNLKGPRSDEIADVIITPRPDRLTPPAPPRIDAIPMPEASRWKELSASLTAEQKDLLRSQGHLFDDQLTPAQRRLVNLPSDATYTLTIVNGDNSITIKSRKQ
jgi:hypothetical protein